MIYNETFWIIYAIFFWVLLAILVVTFIAETYVRLMYYHWDKQDRQDDIIREKVGEIANEQKEPPGYISEVEN